VTDPNSGCQWLLQSGKIKLTPANTSVAHSCSNGASSISWNPVGHFEITGTVNTEGYNLELGNKNSTLRYRGKGVLRAGTGPSDSSVKTALYGTVKPVEALYNGVMSGGYPDHNVLGVVTSGNVEISATASSNEIAAIIYSGGTVKTDKQSLIVGSLVAEQFDIGSQVPKIAYHPGVRTAAETLCLPGSFCVEGEVPPNPGILSDISIERRDTAAIGQ
jgi:hypothetical protein